MKTRLLSIVLALALLCAMFPASALSVSALDDGYAEIGNCGDYLCWTYDLDHNILEIYGYGSMEEFAAEEDVPWHEHRAEMVSLTLPDGMTNISNYAFKDCVNLTEVKIPQSVTKLGVSAFQGCTGLTEANLPQYVSEIGSAAFFGCTGLTEMDIPWGVTEISGAAFAGCTGLRSVTLRNGLETIKINAFFGCSGLRSIKLPAGLTRIGVNAFGFCTGLYSVTFPDSLTTIADSAFQSCSDLAFVKLPADVTLVKSSAFHSCASLNNLLVLNPDCELEDNFMPSSGTTIWGYDDSTAHTYADSHNIPFRNLDPITGECGAQGDNLLWSFSPVTGTLTITGSGAMADYTGVTPWISYRHQITSVSLPEGLTTIGSYAFADTYGITAVTLPDSLVSIGSCAFSNCTGLCSVNFPEGLAEIGNSAFSGCISLDSVVLPDGLGEIGEQAFASCTSLFELRLPTELAAISPFAFRNCSSLETVSIPESVTEIGAFAFYGCTNLRTLSLSAGLSVIGGSAFQNCAALPAVTIPASVNRIEAWAFDGCASLETLVVVSTDCYLDDDFFTPGETTLVIWGYLNSTAAAYADIHSIIFYPLDYSSGECGAQGDNLLWSFSPVTGTLTITGSGAMADYNGVEPWMVYRSLITSISFPEGLTTIGNKAFDDTYGITSLTFPDSLISIGSNAFGNCTGLRSVSFPEGLEEIGKRAFSSCVSLESLVLPDGLAVIGTNAFSACKGLLHVSLPTALEAVPPSAFSQCSNLRSVVIPEHVTEIGEWAFSDCTNLFTVSLPEGLTAIRSYAFIGCQSLDPVLIPESVTLIEEFAFCDCSELQTLIILNASCTLEDFFVDRSDTLTIWGHDNSTAYDYAVRKNIHFHSLADISGECGANGDNLLWSLDLNTGTLTITGSGDMALYDSAINPTPWHAFRSEILRVVLPEGLSSIGSFAFSNCENLTSVQLPASLTVIRDGAFLYCTGLTEIAFPAGLTEIGNHAFADCSGLSSVTIPGNVSFLGMGAFASCTGLTAATLSEGITSVADCMFTRCTSLSSVSLPNGLTTISDVAFGDCSALTTISFPQTLTYIYDLAFEGCDLRSVTIPANVSYIGERVFNENNSLNDVTVYNPNCEFFGLGSTFGGLSSTTLYGYQNSTLQAYAEAFGYRFCPLDRFTDVKPTAWYAVPVAWAYDNEITAGTGGGTFSPNKPCTREQIATFIWKAYGAPEADGTENPFTDVNPEKYYAPAVLWAYYHEPQITGGMNAATFGVDKPCTRAQVVTFLWAAAGKPEPTTTENPFTDVKETDYFYKAVLWAVENGITSGVSPTTFAPKQTCTRAQVVTFLYKAVG